MNTQSESSSEPRIAANGRPLGIRGVRMLASRHSRDCIHMLAGIVNDWKASDADRVRAAEVILSYATSRPATNRDSGDSHGA